MTATTDWTHTHVRTGHASPRWPYYVMGALAIVAGAIALFSPYLATLSATFLVSALLLANGITIIVTAFWQERTAHVFAALLLGVVSMLGGWAIFAAPLAGVLSITVLIGAYFFATGLTRLYWAITHRDRDGWIWLLGSGVLSIALSLLVLFQFREAALVLPGLLLGLDLIVSGAALILLGRASRKASHQ